MGQVHTTSTPRRASTRCCKQPQWIRSTRMRAAWRKSTRLPSSRKVGRSALALQRQRGESVAQYKLTLHSSTSIQPEPHLAQEMQSDPHQAGTPPLYRRELGPARSHDPLLWHLQTVSEQRCLAPPDGLPGHQGARQLCRRCHYGHLLNYEGYLGRQRCCIPSQCHSRPLPCHRRFDCPSH